MENYIFEVVGGDYRNIGYVSNTVKKILNTRKIASIHSRRIAIAIFEVETNIILYARKGTITVQITNDRVIVQSVDEGPGIENVAIAIKEGYTTANEHIRKLGFGAGLGLANINRNSDIVWMSSMVNKGMQVILVFIVSCVL